MLFRAVIDNKNYDRLYQDTTSADFSGNIHLSLRELCESVPKEYRHKVYCMHINNKELIDAAKKEGFNIVETGRI